MSLSPPIVSWKEKVLSAADISILLVQSTFPDGRYVFYFVKCTTPKASELKKVLTESTELNLELYGTILHSGWGIPQQTDFDLLAEHHNIQFFE